MQLFVRHREIPLERLHNLADVAGFRNEDEQVKVIRQEGVGVHFERVALFDIVHGSS